MYKNDCQLLFWNKNCSIFQSVLERQGDEWKSSSNCGRIAAKIARFINVNSEIIGRKFTNFVHDVAKLLPFKLLKEALLSANPMSNARAKSKCCWGCLRTSPNLTGCDRQTNIGIINFTNTPTKPVMYIKIHPEYSEIFGVTWRFLPYRRKERCYC